MRNCHTVFHNGYTILHSHWQCTRIQFFHILINTYFLFLIIAILVGVKVWFMWLIVVLICISIMNSDIEHLFMYLLTVCISSLDKYLFKPFTHFWIGLFFCCQNPLYILDINPLLICDSKYFLSFFGLPFHSVDSVLWCTRVFNFGEVQFIYFYFCCLCFWCPIQEVIDKSNIMKFFSYVFF